MTDSHINVRKSLGTWKPEYLDELKMYRNPVPFDRLMDQRKWYITMVTRSKIYELSGILEPDNQFLLEKCRLYEGLTVEGVAYEGRLLISWNPKQLYAMDFKATELGKFMSLYNILIPQSPWN